MQTGSVDKESERREKNGLENSMLGLCEQGGFVVVGQIEQGHSSMSNQKCEYKNYNTMTTKANTHTHTHTQGVPNAVQSAETKPAPQASLSPCILVE